MELSSCGGDSLDVCGAGLDGAGGTGGAATGSAAAGEAAAAVRDRAERALREAQLAAAKTTLAEARARLERDGVTYYFCSVNCRDSFERHAQRYAVRPDCSWLARTAGGVSSES